MSNERLRVLALASYPEAAASSRFRIVQFLEPLRQRGIDVEFLPFLDAALFDTLYEPKRMLWRLPRLAVRVLRRLADAMHAADVVFVQREAMLFGPAWSEWLATRVRKRPLVLDLDDATWLPYASPVWGRAARLLKFPAKTDRLIDRAHTVVCGNPHIAEHVKSRGGESVIIPTVVDLEVFHPATREHEVPVVGWIGSHGTFPYLERLLPVLEEVAKVAPFRLSVVGAGREVTVRGVDVDQRPWTMEREPEEFRALDVGLYPLDDDAWSAGKSGLKAVAYMASGVPFVVAPVGVCATLGIEGETHFAARTEAEWRAALQRLVSDPQLRRTMGRAGRQYAERHLSLEAQADALASVLRKAASCVL